MTKRGVDLIRKAQFWSMDAIIAVVVFMVAFILVLGIIVELGQDDERVDLQAQGATIQAMLAADRPISFLSGVAVDADRLAFFTAQHYEDLRDEFSIDRDFCIFFEDENGNIIPIPSTGGTAPGIGHPDVTVGGGECRTGFGICKDIDGDGYGDGPDCIDADPDPKDADVTPETVDDWCDGTDNDDDGDIDEDASPLEGMSCGLSMGMCSEGTWSCMGALGMRCSGSVPPRPEICNSADDDCDGIVDDDCSACVDNDVDGHEAVYCGGDDCNDGSATVNPSALERCGDGVDNDCDGAFDEDCLPICRDDDGDGHQAVSCKGDDCNDLDPRIFPGATEVCDDGLDNNCDAKIDLADPGCVICTDADADADGHFTTGSGPSCAPADDCDDGDPMTYPGATEPDCSAKDFNCDGIRICVARPACTADESARCTNSIDDDCDGSMDCMDTDCAADVACRPVCTDADGDGYKDEWCGGDDCDDASAGVNPGATDSCNNLIDEDCSGSALRDDTDGDSYQDEWCGGDDCDDTNPDIHPGQVEEPGDGIDNNCNHCDARTDIPLSLLGYCFSCVNGAYCGDSACCFYRP